MRGGPRATSGGRALLLAACLVAAGVGDLRAGPGEVANDSTSGSDSTRTSIVHHPDDGPDAGRDRSDPGDDGAPGGSAAPMVLAPLVTGTGPCLLVIALAYVVCWLGTDLVVPRLARDPRPRHLRERATGPDDAEPGPALTPAEEAQEVAAIKRLGRIIGKCENVLTVTFVIAGQGTGLAIIFTAKAIARQREIRADSGYYLGGTLLNFTISVAIAQVARVLIAGLP